jgi:hypothetical protein
MIKSKKAMIFVLTLAVLTVFLFVPNLYTKILMKAENSYSNLQLGQVQYSLMTTVQDAESDLFYVDQAARYSAYMALNELERKGGYYDVPECGNVGRYNIW